jgi:phosphonoacetaldehyde hydrolase
MLKAVILDWAGTTVDFGCHAPVVVLKEVFREAGVEITSEEARLSMGVPKKDHIRSILSLPRIASAWRTLRGNPHDEADVEKLYAVFIPLQTRLLAEHSSVIPGVPEAVEAMRARGLRIGSSTGYTRAMLDVLCEKAGAQGYRPDTSVTPEEAGGGRPAPWMCFVNMQRLGVFPPRACVKIGDTPADIEEGLNAGMWTVGVIDSGNEVGLSLADWQALDESERASRRARARDRLNAAGAHFVIDRLDEIGTVFDKMR